MDALTELVFEEFMKGKAREEDEKEEELMQLRHSVNRFIAGGGLNDVIAEHEGNLSNEQLQRIGEEVIEEKIKELFDDIRAGNAGALTPSDRRANNGQGMASARGVNERIIADRLRESLRESLRDYRSGTLARRRESVEMKSEAIGESYGGGDPLAASASIQVS